MHKRVSITRTSIAAITLLFLIGLMPALSYPGSSRMSESEAIVPHKTSSPTKGTTRQYSSTPTVLEPASDSEVEVGVLYWSMNIPGQVAMRKGLEDQAKKINATGKNRRKIKLIPNVAGDGVAGMERQIKQMYALIEKGVKLIIVQPTDIVALKEPLQKANKVGIPVIAYDQHILGGDLASFVTSDNYQAGYLDGEYIAANFPAKRKLRIVMVEYPHVSSTVSRVDGFIDALEFYQQSYDIINTYSAVEPVSGAAAGQAILRDFPDKHSIDAVFTINDGGGLAVAKALEDAGRNEIFFASVDGDPVSVDNIRRGSIARIDSAQFCGEIGAEAMRTAYQVLMGKKVSREILVPVFPITRETVNMYHGWTAPIPPPFVKPWHSSSPQWNGEIIKVDSIK